MAVVADFVVAVETVVIVMSLVIFKTLEKFLHSRGKSIIQVTVAVHVSKHVQYSPLAQAVKGLIQHVRVVKQWSQMVRLVQVVVWYFSVK